MSLRAENVFVNLKSNLTLLYNKGQNFWKSKIRPN